MKVSLTIFFRRIELLRIALRRYRTSTPAPVARYGGTASLFLLPPSCWHGMVLFTLPTTVSNSSCRSSSLFHNLRSRLYAQVLRLYQRATILTGMGYLANLYKAFCQHLLRLCIPAAPALRCCKIGVVRLGFIRQLIQPAYQSIRFSRA